MIIRVIDFETTGFPPDASVCEAAFVDVKDGLCRDSWSALVKPTTPMTIEALATHHIPEQDAISFGISWDQAYDTICGVDPIHRPADFFAAHHADFEKVFFCPAGSKWIDTLKVALRLWPDSPSHSNQVLRYYLNMDLGEAAMPPHRAAPDAYVTARILIEAMKGASIDDILKWSEEPPYLTKLTFGKHKGQKFSEVPHGYLEWMLKQDMEPGVIAAAKRELGR